MGYLAGGQCYENIEQAQSVIFNHGPISTLTCPDPYFLSYNGGWHYISLSCGSLSVPVISFPDCEYQPFDLSVDPSFWVPLFWAVGISAAFVLFKRAVV